MRILLTTISLSAQRGGGTAERTRKLAKYLAMSGEQVDVATIEDGSFSKILRDDGIGIYCSGYVRIKFVIPMLSVQLVKLIKRSDVVHILGFWNLLSVATAFVATLFGKPYLLCAAGEFAALERPRPIAKLFFALFGRYMIGHARAILAITELEKQQIVANLSVDENRVFVLPNGVDRVATSPDSVKSRLVPTASYILFVGRLAEVKGPDLLVEAFAKICERYPSVDLVIAGPDFGLEKELKELASLDRLKDRVFFIGFVNETDRSVLYGDALFVAVPSRSEAMSLVAVEAGILGKAVLVTDQCGLDEVRTINGGIVCAPNIESLAQGIEDLLNCSDLAQKGMAWQSVVVEKYTWTKVAARFVELCKQQP